MRELTYRQKVAKHYDRMYTKKELIWKYIQLAEMYGGLAMEHDDLKKAKGGEQ